MQNTWNKRLEGCQLNVDVWLDVLSVRSLVIPPEEDIKMRLKFASLCRNENRLNLALKTLIQLGVKVSSDCSGKTSTVVQVPSLSLHVNFAYQKYLYAVGEKVQALNNLKNIVGKLKPDDEVEMKVKCYLKLGKWQLDMHERNLPKDVITEVLGGFKIATELDPTSYHAWHAWAIMNFTVIERSEKEINSGSKILPSSLASHLEAAVRGFFKSISLAPHSSGSNNVLQDILRLLTLWFKNGMRPSAYKSLSEGFKSVNIDTWLQVIPQLIARINSNNTMIVELLMELLKELGKKHPQALIYSLTVSSKSPVDARKKNALILMESMRRDWPVLVDQAQLVSRELIRVAILWHEMWHSGLEEASR